MKIVTHAESKSRRVGMKFESLVELSWERSTLNTLKGTMGASSTT